MRKFIGIGLVLSLAFATGEADALKFNPAMTKLVGPILSPITPYIADKAYFRVEGTFVYDSLIDAMLLPPTTNLLVFVHGTPGKATTIDCAMDGTAPISNFIELGADDANAVADPQHVISSTNPTDGHYVFVVPADTAERSPTHWFAVRATMQENTTLYGCAIQVAQ